MSAFISSPYPGFLTSRRSAASAAILQPPISSRRAAGLKPFVAPGLQPPSSGRRPALMFPISQVWRRCPPAGHTSAVQPRLRQSTASPTTMPTPLASNLPSPRIHRSGRIQNLRWLQI